MKYLIGIIQKNGTVITDDGKIFHLDYRGTDSEGYSEVLIDAKKVGGAGWMRRQSIKPYIGMKCSFITNNDKHGYNFEILL
jgi:hypothetical protein